MEYKECQNITFIERTEIIIQQYKKFVMPQVTENEQFEVTLFLNCLLGLLIIPQQTWFDQIPEEYCLSSDEWGIKNEHISNINGDNDLKIKNIAKHLRNSVAHYRFELLNLGEEKNKITDLGEGKNEITDIKFEDFDHEKTFEATIPIAALIQFTTKFTDVLINNNNTIASNSGC
jgi:hypothetical protein